MLMTNVMKMMNTLSDHYDDDDNDEDDYDDDEADDEGNQRNMFSSLQWKTVERRCLVMMTIMIMILII